MKKSKIDTNRIDLVTCIDKYGMAIGPMFSGKGDSIGRTFRAYIAWKKRFIGVYMPMCWKEKKLYRHPVYEKDNMSRDHVFYFYMFMHQVKADLSFLTIKALPGLFRRISNLKNSAMLPGLWTFIRALHYKNKAWYRFLYYLWEVPVNLFMIPWSMLWFKIGGFDQCYIEKINNNIFIQPYPEVNRKQQKWLSRNFIFPVYALHNLAWQLYYLRQQKDSWANKLLRKLILWHNEYSNYAIKLLCGVKVDKELIENYQSFETNRWTTSFDLRNDRELKYRTGDDIEYNNLDRDYLIGLYEMINK